MTANEQTADVGTWEAIATDRSWGRYLNREEGRLVDQATALAGPPGAMLDIGCETGRWAKSLAEQGWSVWATEVDQEALAIAEARIGHGRFLGVDPDRDTLPVPTDAVSLVVCMEVAPVMNAAWFPGELARVLQPGGVIAGTMWNRRSWRGLVGQVTRNFGWYQHPYHEWRDTLEAAGFELNEEVGLCWLPFSRGSNSSLVEPLVGMERRLGLHRVPRWSPWVGFVATYRP